MKKIMFGFLLSTFLNVSQASHCSPPSNPQKFNNEEIHALSIVAEKLQYTLTELCELPRLADIYITDKILYNELKQAELHTWITLHYSESSCQYFVKKSDLTLTKMNCYNTW